MPHLVIDGIDMGGRHTIRCFGFDPEIKPTPGLSSMLSYGHAIFDEPGHISPMTDELRAQVPKIVRVGKPHRMGVPDIIVTGRGFVFSRRMRDKIEELEPDVHKFFPMRALRDDDSADYGEFYLIHLTQRPDIIDHERTPYGAKRKELGAKAGSEVGFAFHWEPTRTGGKGNPIISFKPGGYLGLHLWRGTVGAPEFYKARLMTGGPHAGRTLYSDPLDDTYFVSDELADYVKTEKIRGWGTTKILEKSIE